MDSIRLTSAADEESAQQRSEPTEDIVDCEGVWRMG